MEHKAVKFNRYKNNDKDNNNSLIDQNQPQEHEKVIIDMCSKRMLDYESPIKKSLFSSQTKRTVLNSNKIQQDGESSLPSNNNVSKNKKLRRSFQLFLADVIKAREATQENVNQLYITEDCDFNQLQTRIPLRVELPPKLFVEDSTSNNLSLHSLQQHDAKRQSLIFDGTKYTNLDSRNFDDKTDESETSSSRNEPSDSGLLSDLNISIASACNEFSFEEKDLLKNKDFLGIDDQANVNLKQQCRNMLSKNYQKKRQCQSLQETKDLAKNHKKHNSAELIPSNNHELVTIPSITDNSTTSMMHGTFKSNSFEQLINSFQNEYDMLSQATSNNDYSTSITPKTKSNTEPQQSIKPESAADVMSSNFQFPASDCNSKKIEQPSTPNNKRYSHNRTKSVVSLDLLNVPLNAISTPPSPLFTKKRFDDLKEETPFQNNNKQITPPKRSPLRKSFSFEQETDTTKTCPFLSPEQKCTDQDDSFDSSMKYTPEQSCVILDANTLPYKPMTNYSSFNTTPSKQPANQINKVNFLSPSRQLSNNGYTETAYEKQHPASTHGVMNQTKIQDICEKGDDYESSYYDSVMSSTSLADNQLKGYVMPYNLMQQDHLTPNTQPSSVSSYVPQIVSPENVARESRNGELIGSKSKIYPQIPTSNDFLQGIEDFLQKCDSTKEVIVIDSADEDDGDVQFVSENIGPKCFSLETGTRSGELFTDDTLSHASPNLKKKKRMSKSHNIFQLCDETALQAKILAMELSND